MREVMPGVTVNRSVRDGVDRIHVRVDGDKLGWVDIRSGEVGVLYGEPDVLLHAVQTYVSAYELDAPGLPAMPEQRRVLGPRAPQPPAGRGRRTKPAEALVGWRRQRRGGRVLGTLRRIVGAADDTAAIDSGIVGERRVAAVLRKLESHGWRHVNSWTHPGRRADLDHFAVGPGGAFAINAKRHPDRSVWIGDRAVRIGSDSQPKYLGASRSDAKWAALQLGGALAQPVPVTPMIVFVDARSVRVDGSASGVTIVDVADLAAHLRALPPTLAPDRVERIYATAYELKARHE